MSQTEVTRDDNVLEHTDKDYQVWTALPESFKELKCEILTKICNLFFKSASIPEDGIIAHVTLIS